MKQKQGGKIVSIHQTYAVFGLGRYGRAVAKELVNNGAEVLAVDTNEEIVNDASMEIPYCKCADVTDPEVLEQLGVGNIDVVIIAIATNLEILYPLSRLRRQLSQRESQELAPTHYTLRCIEVRSLSV